MSSGTASSLTKVVEFQVQPGAALVIDKDSTLMLKDNGATETAGASKVTIQMVSANKLTTKILAESTYTRLKVQNDVSLQFHPINTDKNYENGGRGYRIMPFGLLQVYISSDQTVYGSASLDFYLEAKAEPV